MINTLKYAKILESEGLPRNQAEAHVKMISDVLEKDIMTKNEFNDFRKETKSEFQNLRSDMKNEFKAVRTEMATEFKAVRAEMATEFKAVRTEMSHSFEKFENRIIIKLGGVTAILIAAATAFNNLVGGG